MDLGKKKGGYHSRTVLITLTQGFQTSRHSIFVGAHVLYSLDLCGDFFGRKIVLVTIWAYMVTSDALGA